MFPHQSPCVFPFQMKTGHLEVDWLVVELYVHPEQDGRVI